MKKLLVIIGVLFATLELSAQNNQIVITENFENGAQLEWIEWTNKKFKAHALVQNGGLHLQGTFVYTGVDIKNVNPYMDFSVKATLVIPNLAKKGWWGLAYNPYTADNGKSMLKAFVFNSEKCAFVRNVPYSAYEFKGGKKYYEAITWPDKKKLQNLRLAAGKNVTVEVEMARKGTEMYFYVDGVEAAVVEAENAGYFAKSRKALTLCFTTMSEVIIDKIVITQAVPENQ